MIDLRKLLDEGQSIFGTDGIRGAAGSELTAELAMDVGRAAGAGLENGPVLVGRDTRRSGSMLSNALQAGFHTVGIDTIDVGVLPTGGIARMTANGPATMGAIISASHNPAEDNGIKLLNQRGHKLADERERQIEDRMRASGSSRVVGQAIGYRSEQLDAKHEYVTALAKTARYSLNGIEVTLDCANGAAYEVAPLLFDRLGASYRAFHAEPNGMNINDGCGATHPEFLAKWAKGSIGLAFDGDADRLIAIDEDGVVANGDVIMAILAHQMKAAGTLRNDLVVATVMSNLGFRRSMESADIEMIETPVGDRYVMEALIEHKGSMGGEQSGHIIFPKLATTGDGLLTAIQLLDVVAGTGKELRQLRAECITEYPQVLVNVPIPRSIEVDSIDAMWDEVRLVEAELGDDGRVLVRPSGTEPLVRIMVEAASENASRGYADRIASVTKDAIDNK